MGSLLQDLANLPSRGLLPAEGSVTVCSRAPNYVAAHSTAPGQRVTTDPTNPLVRTLKLKKAAGRKRKEPPATASAAKKAKSSGAGSSGMKPAARKKPPAAEASQASAQLRSYSQLELKQISIKGLQDILRAHGAPVSGRKAELVERVMALQQQAASPQQGGGGTPSGSPGSGVDDNPIVLSEDEDDA